MSDGRGARLTFLVVVWWTIKGFDGSQTRAHSTSEDEGRAEAWLLLLTASIVSLVAVGNELAEATTRRGSTEVVFVVAGLVTVAGSWALVHTLYTLRYAHLYYTAPIGGVDFCQDDEPDYHDFAYLAFTVGMTFQVSDTNVTSATLRRSVLAHALVSFLFGAFILAVSINVVAGLVQT